MILITRPVDDANNMQEILSRKGYEVLVEPMLTIKKTLPKIAEAQHYITTSNNADHAVVANSNHLQIPDHGNTAGELVEHIISNYTPQDGKFIYLRGNQITLDIKAALKDAGFEADEVVVYKSAAPDKFSDDFTHNVYKIQIATFFSAQSLENFMALVKKHNLKEAVKGIKLLALSEKIAQKANKYDWKGIFVSDLPNQQSLIEKLEEIL